LNLQNASVVVNCDLPWNPARLEQRIARAWRKHQTRPVTVLNLVSENTLEHRMLDTLATKQTIAESVLDFPGRVTEIKIRGGRQAFLARLQQLVSPISSAPPQAAVPRPTRPADPALAFAEAVREKINGNLVRCEERYPLEGAHSVVLVVVDRDAPAWRERLVALQEEFFNRETTDPLAPTRIEVIDRSTDEAVQRLIAAGLLGKAERAIRPLLPGATVPIRPALTAEEQARVASHHAQAERKLKMARLLADGDLAEEARAAALEGALSVARAMAVQRHFPEPPTLDEALRPPVALQWKEGGAPIREFLQAESKPSAGLMDYLLGHRSG
jgi:hypothetical protein